MTADEIRAGLVAAHDAEQQKLRAAEANVAILEAKIQAHDAAVAALSAQFDPAHEGLKQRRHIPTEIMKLIQHSTLTVADLRYRIGDVSEKQITKALDKLKQQGRASKDANDLWISTTAGR